MPIKRKSSAKPVKRTVTIRQKVVIPATTAEVYAAFVDAKKHSAFTGAKAAGKGKVGSSFTAWDGYISGMYLEMEKNKRLLMMWKTVSWTKGYPPSLLELTFTKHGKGTQISMVHSKVPPIPAKGFRPGWKESYWDLLQAYFSK